MSFVKSDASMSLVENDSSVSFVKSDPSTGFELHAQLAADCFVVGDLPLCRVLMLNDAQYPWFILVPRRVDMREIHHLDQADQQQFWRESACFSQLLEDLFQPDKLNVAALGNMVPQLHVHHIARYQGDAAWPAPVWGKVAAVTFSAEASAERLLLVQGKMAELDC